MTGFQASRRIDQCYFVVGSAMFVLCFMVISPIFTSALAQSYSSGDINLDGALNVADAQCMSLVNLAKLAGDEPLPGCLKVPVYAADMDCDQVYSTADITRITQAAINDVSNIQSGWDVDYYSGWSVLAFDCQRDYIGGSADVWRCPYDFVNHTAVALGHSFTCSLDQDGRVWCWGTDDQGVLGNYAVSGAKDVPTLVHRNGAYLKLDANGYGANKGGTVCAISAIDSTLWCWGNLRPGATFRPGPNRVSHTTTTWLDVAVGLTHACGIQNTDPVSLWCWGNNDNGQLGVGGSVSDGTTAFPPRNVTNPSSPHSPWVSVTVGDDLTCGLLENGDAYCWGRNDYGQVGQGDRSVTPVMSPALITGSHTWTQLSTYNNLVCGITDDDDLYCWGYGGTTSGSGETGQLGVGTPPTCTDDDECCLSTSGHVCTAIPWAVDTDAEYSEIEVGHAHACGITSSPSVRLKCWGKNDAGQLGLGTTSYGEDEPQQVDSSTAWAGIGLGFAHTCGFKVVGGGPGTTLYCWGAGADGQIGNDDDENQNTPAEVDVFVTNCACGDESCSGYENELICHPDCGYCGDDMCITTYEDPTSCDEDCMCDDGKCQEPEDEETCSEDCGYCGDSVCQSNETAFTCADDCHYCGDGFCNGSETTSNCGIDCLCGNTICGSGETPANCPTDCGYCGDDVCTETNALCPEDCYCGNGTCDSGENNSNCSADCDP